MANDDAITEARRLLEDWPTMEFVARVPRVIRALLLATGAAEAQPSVAERHLAILREIGAPSDLIAIAEKSTESEARVTALEQENAKLLRETQDWHARWIANAADREEVEDLEARCTRLAGELDVCERERDSWHGRNCLAEDERDAQMAQANNYAKQVRELRGELAQVREERGKLLTRYLDNHCSNADAEGMSTLCECKLCLDTRVALSRADTTAQQEPTR